FDPEIERTARRLRKEDKQRNIADERKLLEYITLNPDVLASRISILQAEENNLDLKPALINMI
ncbi:hypothetical protein SESBI_43983, partial [Sesbania bispinosa]